MGPNSDVLENSTFFSKTVGPISHVFVGPNSYKSGGTRHVPPYLYIPKFFDYLEFHCPTEEKIGIDEKVICYHNISNLLWKKDVLCVWKEK